MPLLKGNALKKRLQDLGYQTDDTDWDKPVKPTDDCWDGEEWEE